MIENFTDELDKHPPISAYEYLKWRLSQSYDDDSYVENELVREDGKQYLPKTSYNEFYYGLDFSSSI